MQDISSVVERNMAQNLPQPFQDNYLTRTYAGEGLFTPFAIVLRVRYH
jgi:hypothetical protein